MGRISSPKFKIEMMSEIEAQRLPDMGEIWQKTMGWQPNSEQQDQFQQLYEEILSGNRQLNLTRITEPIEFWEKHLWDSLRGIAPLGLAGRVEQKQSQSVIDIGTGAGFPGIPVAIALPTCTITLLDSTRKKVRFLETLLPQLGINNATTLIGRAEQIGQQRSHRESYDIALVRAVGAASICAEYALPFLKTDGMAVLYRGHWGDEDTKALLPAVEQLGGATESIEEFMTPLSTSIRHCIYLRKLSQTPNQFPRTVGMPVQQPL